jgi:hypothetical protein
MPVIIAIALLCWYVWGTVMSFLHPAGIGARARLGYRAGLLLQSMVVVPAFVYVILAL